MKIVHPGEPSRGRAIGGGDFAFLAYVQHMAATARSEPAKQLFDHYLKQEKQFQTTNGSSNLA